MADCRLFFRVIIFFNCVVDLRYSMARDQIKLLIHTTIPSRTHMWVLRASKQQRQLCIRRIYKRISYESYRLLGHTVTQGWTTWVRSDRNALNQGLIEKSVA
jgi:hypothetical protein